MALPVINQIETDIGNLYAALAADPTRQGMRQGVEALGEVTAAIRSAYKPDVTVNMLNGVTATLAAAFTGSGEIKAALGIVRVGDIFTITGSNDTLDDALEAVKGSQPAAGDRFQITSVSTPAVLFLGNADPSIDAFDSQDFRGVTS